jgi:hypothetical protein
MSHNWRIYERDIDVFLAEEFYANPSFASWVLHQTKNFRQLQATVVEVAVSLSDQSGESDLVVIYEQQSSESRFALLFEDKIDAQFQPNQLDRYRQRGDAGILSDKWGAYEVVLCAPQGFLERHPVSRDFDAALSFEDIATFIRKETPGPRGEYRADFLTTAAPRGSSAYVKIKDAETDAFWVKAYEVAQRDFSILEMRTPNYASNANWVIFRPSDIPTNIWTEFKGALGNVDMTFYGVTFEELSAAVGSLLENDMLIVKVGKSPAIRLKANRFFVADGFEQAEANVRIGLEASSRLIQFYRKNRIALSALSRAGRNK